MDSVNRLLNMQERLEVWRVNGKIAVSLQKAEIKDGMFLCSTFGEGDTIYEACDDYMQKISGKCLVFNAYTKSRRFVCRTESTNSGTSARL